jgi:hypothetical protein
MFIILGGSQEVLLAYFQKLGENVNSASYSEVLLKLRDAIRRKRSGQLARGYCFIMTVPDTIKQGQPRGKYNNHSSELASSDFHLFDPL